MSCGSMLMASPCPCRRLSSAPRGPGTVAELEAETQHRERTVRENSALRVLVEVTRQIVGTLDECDDGKFRKQVSIVEGCAELERKIRVHSRGRAAPQPLPGDARRGVELEPVHHRARAQADGEAQHLAARE